MEFWNVVGLVLTFCGTALTFWQTYKAKSYRDEIQADRKKFILMELLPIAKSARDECKNYNSSKKPMRGVDPQKVIHTIQILAEKLQEHSHHKLKGNFSLKEAVTKMSSYITNYINESDQDSRNKIADQIYSELNSIIELLAGNIDNSI